jgi:hypothetical protein
LSPPGPSIGPGPDGTHLRTRDGVAQDRVDTAAEWQAVVLDGDEDAFTARYVDREGRLLA